MSSREIEILKRTLARERAARKQAEEILEKKSEELFYLNQKIKDSKEKVEALLQVKNSELKGFFENIVDPYIMMDLFGNAIKMNQAAEELTGYKLSESSLNLMKLTIPEELHIIESSFHSLHSKGRIADLRITLKTKQEEERLVHLNASIIYDEHHKPVAAQGIFRDITKQNKAKIKLMESEDRMSTLLLSLESGVVLEDQEGEIVLTNQSFCDLLEIESKPADLKGKQVVDVIKKSNFISKTSKDFIPRTIEILHDRKVLEGEEIELTDGRVLKREYTPIFKDNTYKGHLWNFKDITLRKKYQKSLEAEKQKYSNIIANMNLGLMEMDKAGRIIYVNQSFEELSGYNKSELQGQRAIDFFLEEKDKEDFVALAKRRQQGISDSYEIKIKNRRGEEKILLVSGAPNYNLNGVYIGTIAINFDITKLKALESQKEQLLKELEKSNENLQEYAHVVSHDLKSPLRSIDALISWIKEDNVGNLNDTTLENFQMIEKTLEKMEGLISDVLAYSSVGANVQLNGQVNIQELVNDLLEVMYTPEHIKINTKDMLPTLSGDKVKLQQVFQNLLSNAIKFCDKEEGIVSIGCKDIGGYYEFSVTDNGIGIEKVYFDKIFEIFNSLEERKDSSGIGLSIVKKIVELHHGRVWLESTFGEGTTFYFTLKK
ncbi:PAS domain-containing sensor histidine kinase [Wenyingzhuangia sp. IMCC45574]